jgi:hypothetical protein
VVLEEPSLHCGVGLAPTLEAVVPLAQLKRSATLWVPLYHAGGYNACCGSSDTLRSLCIHGGFGASSHARGSILISLRWGEPPPVALRTPRLLLDSERAHSKSSQDPHLFIFRLLEAAKGRVDPGFLEIRLGNGDFSIPVTQAYVRITMPLLSNTPGSETQGLGDGFNALVRSRDCPRS